MFAAGPAAEPRAAGPGVAAADAAGAPGYRRTPVVTIAIQIPNWDQLMVNRLNE